MRKKHLSLGKRGCPENPSNVQTLPSAYEKHLPIRSGKQTTMPSSKRRATQSKTNTGMTASQHHVFTANSHGKVPSAFAVLKVNFFPLFQPRVAEAKSLLSRNRHTVKGRISIPTRNDENEKSRNEAKGR
jgi:hypothetical protein